MKKSNKDVIITKEELESAASEKVLDDFISLVDKLVVEEKMIWVKLGNEYREVKYSELDYWLDAGWALKDDCGCK